MAKLVLFSPMRGVVLAHGAPVAGAKIARDWRWTWKQQNGADGTVTDAAGRFSLPVVEGRSLLGGVVPHEPLVRQTILIEHGGQIYKAWMLDKHNYEMNGEHEERRPIAITCRLEAVLHHSGDIYGICDID